MKDMFEIIAKAMRKNSIIVSECADRIKAYTYPESADSESPFVLLRPIRPPLAANYASDKNLSYSFAIQIDVQSKDPTKCKLIQHAIKQVMDDLGFTQQTNDGLDEYLDGVERFVDARRYFKVTNLYDTDY